MNNNETNKVMSIEEIIEVIKSLNLKNGQSYDLKTNSIVESINPTQENNEEEWYVNAVWNTLNNTK